MADYFAGTGRIETYLLEEHGSSWTAYPLGLKAYATGRGSSPTEALDAAKRQLERHVRQISKKVA